MKRLLILILIALPFLSNAQWQGSSGVWQRNSVANQWRYNAGQNGLFNPYDVFEKIQDGLISGGNATTNGDSLIVASGVARITTTTSVNYSFSSRTFANISPSATGLTRILIVYANTFGLLDSIAGSQSNNPVEPTLPSNTVRVVTVPINDAGLGTPTVDLSGYALKSETYIKTDFVNQTLLLPLLKPNTFGFIDAVFPALVTDVGNGNNSRWEYIFTGDKNRGFITVSSYATEEYYFGSYADNSFLGWHNILSPDTISNNLVINGSISTNNDFIFSDNAGYGLVSANFTRQLSVTNSGIGVTNSLTANSLIKSGGTSSQFLKADGSIDANSYATTSYADAKVQNSLTASTTIAPSATAVNTGLATRENPLTFGYGLTRATNTITADTTSGTGLVSKTRLTGALASKQNNISFGTIGSTPNANGASISGSVITLQPASSTFGGVLTSGTQSIVGLKTFLNSPQFTSVTTSSSNYRLVTRNQTSGAIEEVDLGTITGGLIYDGITKTLAVAPSADRTTAGEVITSSNRTITLSDFGSNGMLSVYCTTTGGSVTITLPSPTVMRGLEITIIKTTASNNVTISGSANINGSASLSEVTAYKAYTLISNGTQYFIKAEQP